jgi:hypothetical protein
MKVALFGAGARGLQCLAALEGDMRFEVVRFFDNDPKKWNTTLRDIPICEPTAKACGDVDAIILASVYAKEILAQLTRLGCAGKVALSPPHLTRRAGGDTPAETETPDAKRTRLLDEAPANVRQLARRLDVAPPTSVGASSRDLACTICCNNYLAYATVLARSFLRHHPDSRFVICLADRHREDIVYPDDSRITVVDAASLGIPGFESFAFKYDVLEFNTAVKPFLLERLLDEDDTDRVLYLDPDILVLAPLDELFEDLTRTPLLLTPHLTQPYEDLCHPREIDILRAGTYNLGFVGLAAHPQTTKLLSWWQARLYDGCTREVEKGYFVDQKWMDFAPSFFPDHKVVRDPGYNAAYWNLHERTVTFERGRFAVNGKRLRFFHFSGVDVNDLDSVSKHQNRTTLPAEGALRDLFELYRALLVTHDHLALKATPYAYGAFDNGVRIPDVVRAVYRETRMNGAYINPFATKGDASFYAWLRAPWRPDSLVSNLFATMRARTAELRLAYSDQDTAGELALLLHLRTAAELYDLPKELVDGDGTARHAAPTPVTAAESGHTAPRPGPSRLPRRVGRSTPSPRPSEPRESEAAWRVALPPSSDAATPYASALDAALRLAVRPEGLIVEGEATVSGEMNAIVVGRVELEPARKGAAPRVDLAYWMWDETWPDDPTAVPGHEIWAPSAYSLEGLSRRVSVPVIDLPLAVGLINGSRTTRESLGIGDEQPLFVSVLDPVTRRGHDPLDTVRAFQEAFAGHTGPVPPPVLTLIGTERDIVNHIEARLAPIALDPARVQIRHVPAGAELIGLLCVSDCYLALHGRVAFDYWLASALWHGRPAITTHIGGVADIATVNNSFLVDVDRAAADAEGELQPDVAHAASLLQLAVDHREERRNRGLRARCDLRATHSVEVVARRMARRLQMLAGRHQTPVTPAEAGVA